METPLYVEYASYLCLRLSSVYEDSGELGFSNDYIKIRCIDIKPQLKAWRYFAIEVKFAVGGRAAKFW
jgi:hypothetical protein